MGCSKKICHYLSDFIKNRGVIAIHNFSKTKKAIRKMPEGSRRELATQLLDKAIFMNEELKKLQESISEKGWTEEYKNGANQFGIKQSSEGSTYNSLIKNYAMVMKQLNDILPSDDSVSDEMMNFVCSKS